jgi:DNA-binding beta-propeller fold protein YncE
VTPEGVVTTFVGSGTSGSADGIGTAAQLSFPRGITIDAKGYLYVTDSHRVRQVTPEGVVSTLAGTETAGNVNGGVGTARFNTPRGIVVDAAGTTLYVADHSNHSIRKVVLE